MNAPTELIALAPSGQEHVPAVKASTLYPNSFQAGGRCSKLITPLAGDGAQREGEM